MQRIQMRDRPFERKMERDYIDRLNAAYEAFFMSAPSSRVLTIETDSLDFVIHPSHLKQITNRIRAALGIPPFQPELPLMGDQPR
jgi:deoxyguanosine kinase